MKQLCILLLLISPITSYAKNADEFVQEAMKYNQSGDTQKAIQAFIKASELSPNNADIHYSIGVLKGCPNGLPYYKNTIKVNINYYPAFLNSGICYEKLKKNMLAIKLYTSALNLKPNNAPLQYNVGNLLHISKKYQESLPFYRKALKLDPDYYWAAINLGNSYEELNQLQKAISSFNKAKEIAPNKSAAYLSLANPLITLKSYKRAKNALEIAGILAIKNNNSQIANPVLTYLKRHYPESRVINQLKVYLKKSPVNDMLKHKVPVITVKGIGTIRAGDVLTHKSTGKGKVRGLYKRNGINWVAFEINGAVSFVNLTAKFFMPL